LRRIGTASQLSPSELTQLWKSFFSTNEQLLHLVQKFETIEEIVANQYAMWHIAPEVRRPEVRRKVVHKLCLNIVDKGYWDLFYTFVMEGRRDFIPVLSNPITPDRALALMELFTLLLDRCGMEPALALHRSIEVMNAFGSKDAEPSLDDVDQWAISVVPESEPLLSAISKHRHKPEYWPQLFLRRRGKEAYIEFSLFNDDSTLKEFCNSDRAEQTLIEDAFWESLRQQLRWSLSTPPFRVHRLICPHKHDYEPCCGRWNLVETLWARIPKRWRGTLTPPPCNS
jgi:hypothetical protein